MPKSASDVAANTKLPFLRAARLSCLARRLRKSTGSLEAQALRPAMRCRLSPASQHEARGARGGHVGVAAH
eukprot:7008099-Pyramimonas_sp.AAC.1